MFDFGRVDACSENAALTVASLYLFINQLLATILRKEKSQNYEIHVLATSDAQKLKLTDRQYVSHITYTNLA